VVGKAIPEQSEDKSCIEQGDNLIEDRDSFWQLLILRNSLVLAICFAAVGDHVGHMFLRDEVGADTVESNQFQGEHVPQYLIVIVLVVHIVVQQKELGRKESYEFWEKTPVHDVVVSDQS